MAKPTLLMTGPMMPLICEGLARHFETHQLPAGGRAGTSGGPDDRECMLARIAPEARMTEFFGLYALSGEATAFAAPAAVAFATAASGSQQWGMAMILVFLSVGFVGLLFVREERAAAV